MQITTAAASKHLLHACTDICRLADTVSKHSATAEQPAPAQKLLADLVSTAVEQMESRMSTLAVIHRHPDKSASEAESMIASTDASLQLSRLYHEAAAGVAAKWDAVQVLPADSNLQQHAITTSQEPTPGQPSVIISAVLAGGSSRVTIQGLHSRPLTDSTAATQSSAAAVSEAGSLPVETIRAISADTEPSWLSGETPADESATSVQGVIMALVTRLLGSDSIGQDEPLMAAGLDSLGATELVQSLQTAFDVSLPATMVFDYPTSTAMAAFISQHVMQGAKQAPIPQTRAVALGRSSVEGRASAMALIAGVAGDQKLLQQWTSSDATTRVPHSRWDIRQQANSTGMSATLAPQFGSFLKDVDQFDSTLFGIMASEALTMDPQQRLLLQTALEAFPNGAGQARGRAIGAYVGIGTSDYNTLMQQADVPFNAFSFTAGSASVASGRLAFAFGLQGPTASIDTACSASLVAAHMACHSFRCVALPGKNMMLAVLLLTLSCASLPMLTMSGTCQ